MLQDQTPQLSPTLRLTAADVGGALARSVTVERVNLAHRWGRIRFARTRVNDVGVSGGVGEQSVFAQTYGLDPNNSPALAQAEAVGLLARIGGRVVGRMVALRPASSGDCAWFSRLELSGGAAVMRALAFEGARWASRRGVSRWCGPVGLMPGDVCGIQVDGFVGRRMGDVPSSPRGLGATLAAAGFAPSVETGFWHLPLPTARRTVARAETTNIDLTDLQSDVEIDWASLIDRLPTSTDPVSRLMCDPDRLRHELLRPAVQGGVSCALVGGAVAAFGMLRPVCALAPGLNLPRWMTRLRRWKRRTTAQEGQARVWSVVEHQADEWLAGTVLDALSARAGALGYRGIVVGPVSLSAQGTIAALRDRGARLQGRFQLYAQEIHELRHRAEKVLISQDSH